MFDQINYRHGSRAGKPIDVGSIFEAILFYQTVHLQIEPGGISAVFREFDADVLLELVEQKHLVLNFHSQMSGVQTQNENFVPTHRIVHFSYAGRDEKRITKPRAVVDHYINRGADKYKYAGGLLRRLKSNVNVIDNKKSFRSSYQQKDFLEWLESDRIAANIIFQNFLRFKGIPGPYIPLTFNIIRAENGFLFSSNFEFGAVEVDGAQLTPAHFLAFAHSVFLEGIVASHFQSEIMCESSVADSLAAVFNRSMTRRVNSQKELDHFYDVVTPELPSLRDAVNSGAMSQREALKLVNAGEKFKSWLKGRSPDANLVEEYYRASNAAGSGGVGSILKFSLLSGASVAASAVDPSGVTGNAVTGLNVIDKAMSAVFSNSWRPSFFVDARLRKALSKAKARDG